MNYGLAFVLIAFGGSLFYKGYKGWTWSQFYATVLQGKAAPAATGSSSGTQLFGSTPAGNSSSASGATSSGGNAQAPKNALAG